MKIYFDFATILTIATFVTGIVWLIDALLFKSKRVQLADEGEAHEPKVVEYCRSFFPILLIVLVLRSFLIEPFRIPSGSMKPSLLEGDFILVNKYAYGLRLPVTGTKMVKIGTPKRGDVLIFRFPNDTSVNFIKRVIAIPGDTVSYKDRALRINGKKVELTYLETDQDHDVSGRIESLRKYKEALPGKAHKVYHAPYDRLQQEEITVPEGHYFVMGDNRDNSEDSRMWGLVPDDLVLGRGAYIWFSWDAQAKDVRWRRMFSEIN